MNHDKIYRRIRLRRDYNGKIAWREITTIYPDGRYEVAHTCEQGDELYVFNKWVNTVYGLGWSSIGELLKARAGFQRI